MPSAIAVIDPGSDPIGGPAFVEDGFSNMNTVCLSVVFDTQIA